jgi:hypothetical protein
VGGGGAGGEVESAEATLQLSRELFGLCSRELSGGVRDRTEYQSAVGAIRSAPKQRSPATKILHTRKLSKTHGERKAKSFCRLKYGVLILSRVISSKNLTSSTVRAAHCLCRNAQSADSER